MKRYALLFLALITINLLYVLLLNGNKPTFAENKAAINSAIDFKRQNKGSKNAETEVLGKDTSMNYKIAEAKQGGDYDIISSESTYADALKKVTGVNNDNLIIVKDDTVLYVKFALLDLKTKSVTNNTYFYVNDVKNYFNGNSASDAVFIDAKDGQYEMELSNARGYIDSTDVNLVPLIDVKSPSYYFLNSYNELVHAISTDIYKNDSYEYSGTIDKAPDYMKQDVKYYSYDGIYFYTDLKELILDLRDNNHGRAINADKPFYAYYEYLPLRGLSNYTASDMNSYLKYKLNQIGLTGDSVLVNSGQYFMNAQVKFKINAVFELAWAIHESDYGTSKIAVNKNNLFGMNATDNNPYGNADGFNSLESGIDYHADNYVVSICLNNENSLYSGASVGNKGSGFNVFYASDPYWGEKIAAIYFQIDKYLGFKDYKNYQIGITVDKTTVYSSTSESNIYYTEISNQKVSSGLPVIILNEKNGFYEIMSNGTVENNQIKFTDITNYNDGSVGFIEKNLVYKPL